MTYWLDVEDLFEYALISRRPSGIQRLSFELYRALVALRPGGIAFCRHDRIRGTLRTVAWAEVEALFAGLTGTGQSASAAPLREKALPVGQAGRVRRSPPACRPISACRWGRRCAARRPRCGPGCAPGAA
ncbi:hypothetical protein ACFQU7_14505 [Pseudoroseomonas wenyumeiae]